MPHRIFVFFQTRFIQPDLSSHEFRLDAIHLFGNQISVNTQKFVLNTELIMSSLQCPGKKIGSV